MAALLLLSLAVACAEDSSEAPPGAATIFLLKLDDGALVAQEVEVAVDQDPLAAALSALVAAADGAGLSSALAPGTELRSVEQAGSIALVDLNAAFAEGFPAGGSQAQTEALAPLIFTATEVAGIESVSITVEGEEPNIRGLAYDLSEPLTRADLPIAVGRAR